MSPRAAWRLESLGFTEVYDYVAGKSDWAAAGLVTEGSSTVQPRLGVLARRDAPTCRLEERVGEVRERVLADGWKTCMVVNDEGIVLGRLFGKELALADDAIVGDVMRSGRAHIGRTLRWLRSSSGSVGVTGKRSLSAPVTAG